MKTALSGYELNWVEQKEQLGTGHAVQQAAPFCSDEEKVVILYGDVPLINPKTLNNLIEAHPNAGQDHENALSDKASSVMKISFKI